jgi:hypothetical protein
MHGIALCYHCTKNEMADLTIFMRDFFPPFEIKGYNQRTKLIDSLFLFR